MRTLTRIGAVLLGVVLALLTAAGCGEDDETPDAVVEVGGSAITQSRYARELARSEASYAEVYGYPTRRYFDPPRFPLCVEHNRLELPAAKAKAACAAQHRGLKASVLQSLIEREWLEQAARRAGIEVSVEAVRRSLNVPDAASEAGPHRLARMRDRLVERGISGSDFTPTSHAVRSYYELHREFFVQPERRDAVAVSFSARRAAVRGRRGGGEPVTYENVSYEETEPTLARVVFKAREGERVGPVRIAGTWYIVEVTRVQRRFQMSLRESQPSISGFLEDNNRYIAQVDFMRRFRERARKGTVCLTALRVPECGNAPRTEFDAYGGSQATLAREPMLPSLQRGT